MAQWVDYWRVVTPQRDRARYEPVDVFAENNSVFSDKNSWYASAMNSAGTRQQKYTQFDIMDNDVYVARSIDTIAEEMTTENTVDSLPFDIEYLNDDDQEISESMIMTLRTAARKFSRIQKLSRRLFNIARMMSKYGDVFYLKKDDSSPWRFIDPRSVIGIEVDEDGDIVYYHIKTAVTANDLSGKANYEITKYPSAAIVHFTTSDESDPSFPFGSSILESVVKTFKQMTLLEDATVIHRIVRAPERKIFYVDVGNLPPQKIKKQLEETKNDMRQRKVVQNLTGVDQIDSIYNAQSIGEDYFLPVTANGRGSRIDTLPGATAQDLDDLDYFRNKLFLGLRVPTSYIKSVDGGQGAQYNDGKVGLAYIEEQRFVNFVSRLQQHIEDVLDIEFKRYIHQSRLNIDLELFRIKLPDPQNFAIYRQAELDQAMINTFTAIEGSEYLSHRFKMKRFLGMDEGEIQTNEALLKQERGIVESVNGNDSSDLRKMYDPAYYENRDAISDAYFEEDLNDDTETSQADNNEPDDIFDSPADDGPDIDLDGPSDDS